MRGDTVKNSGHFASPMARFFVSAGAAIAKERYSIQRGIQHRSKREPRGSAESSIDEDLPFA